MSDGRVADGQDEAAQCDSVPERYFRWSHADNMYGARPRARGPIPAYALAQRSDVHHPSSMLAHTLERTERCADLPCPGCCSANLDHNEMVDVSDLLIVLGEWD